MDDIPLHFNTFFFEPQNNFGWWRICLAPYPKLVAENFSIENEIIFYDKLPLNSIHTHLKSKQYFTLKFNTFIQKLIRASHNKNLLSIIPS
jgi:hypothetical protein